MYWWIKSGSSLIPKIDKILFSKPTNFSKPLAKIEKGRVLLIQNCNDDWCKVKTGSFKGWVKIEKSTNSGSNWSTIASGYGYAAGGGHYPNLSCSVSVTLNSGDYVRIYVENQYVYAHTQSAAYNPTFSGFLVG